MDLSRRIARILGPVLLILSITEGANLDAFAGNPAAVVYLNGTILLTAGVAILQARPVWGLNWRGLITGLGCAMTLAGVYRMGWPGAAQLAGGAGTYAVLAALAVAGLILSWQGYRRER